MHGPLKGSDSRPNDAFAQSVDISGGTTVIGAPYELGESGMQAGAAYLFGEGDPAPPAENQAPVADDQQVSTPQDTAVAITLTGSDADGDELSYAVADDPAHGSLSGDAPDLTYTPADGYHGSDDFTFTVDDGNGGSDTGTVSITVTPAGSEPNQAPVAQDASIDATEGRPATVTIEASDADGDELSYAVGDAPGNGTVSGDGPEITYTSDSGFTGDDSFTVDVCDPSNACDTATVTIEVAPWDPPAQPPADAGQLTVNPSTVNAGDIVSVSGSGFEPYETVFLVLYSETTRLAAIPAGDDGTLAGTITIPDGTEPGEHQLVAYGEETALAAPLTVIDDMDDPKDDPKGSGSPRGGPDDDLKVKRFVDHAPEPGGKKLAMTGAAVVPLLGLGGALIALGGAWLLAARRARHR